MKKYDYTIEYRLDDINNYDYTDYIDNIPTKKEARQIANKLKKEYGSRLVLLDIKKCDEDGYLEDVETII